MASTTRVALLVLAGAAACTPAYRGPVLVNPAYDHATAERLANPYPAREDETPYDAIDFLSPAEKVPVAGGEHAGQPGSPDLDPTAGFDPAAFRQPVDWAAIRAPQGVQVTWLGHAAFLVQLGGVTFVTDPALTELPLHWLLPAELRRVSPPVVSPRDLAFVDAVLISHNHHDHLDFETLRALPPVTPYVVPLRVGRHFGSRFTSVTELDWFMTTRVGEVTVTLVPAQHRSARTPWDRNETLWGGFVLEHAGKKVYYAGDTAHSPVFDDIHAQMGDLDVCLLPATSYRPYAFRHGHMTPEWAVEAAVTLHCKQVVPWGYGTFVLGREHVLEPLRRLEKARQDLAPTLSMRVLRMGETARF